MSAPDRRAKLDRDHAELSIRRQCKMLGVARSFAEPPGEKSFSIVSWPILACSFSISRAHAASASSPTLGSNARAAWSSSCFFQV